MAEDNFYIAPEGRSSDTIISYVLAVVSYVFIILGIVKSVMSKGDVERVYAVLMLSAILLTATGTVFGVIGYKTDAGHMTVNKIAIIINGIALVISSLFLIKGFH